MSKEKVLDPLQPLTCFHIIVRGSGDSTILCLSYAQINEFTYTDQNFQYKFEIFVKIYK